MGARPASRPLKMKFSSPVVFLFILAPSPWSVLAAQPLHGWEGSKPNIVFYSDIS